MKHLQVPLAILGVGLLAACTEGPTQAALSIPTIPPTPYIVVLRDTASDVATATTAVVAAAIASDPRGTSRSAAARTL
ncbi:MAG: hypothetical protein ACK5T7_02510, partial [Gemmatimonas sp.]